MIYFKFKFILIFWNGYNIAFFEDANEYVKTYQNLVDKVKEQFEDYLTEEEQ